MRFSRFAVLAAATAVLLLFGVGAKAETYQLKASIFTPPSNPLARAMYEWAALLKKKSAGRLDIKIFPGSQMGPPPRQFDLVRSGVADIAVMLHGLAPGRFPLVELAHMPGVLGKDYVADLALTDVYTHLAKTDHPGVKIINVVVVVPLPIISKNPIISAADLKGMRIRAAGSVQSEYLTALGAVPTLVQPGDMNEALGKGMIEAASVGYSGIASYHLADVAKFIAVGDIGAATFATVMNKSAYDKLPPDLRKIIDENSGVASVPIFGRLLSDDETAIRDQLAKAGVKEVALASPKITKTAVAKVQKDALARAAAAGFDGQNFLDRLKKAIEKYNTAK